MHALFEIVWQISPDGAPVVLRSVWDANAATIAFSEELTRLRGHRAPGELLVRGGEGDQHLFLREDLKRSPADRGQQ